MVKTQSNPVNTEPKSAIKNKVIKQNVKRIEKDRNRRARITKCVNEMRESIGLKQSEKSEVLTATYQYLREMTKLIDDLKTLHNQKAAFATTSQKTLEFFEANPQYDAAIRDSVVAKLDERIKGMDMEIAQLTETINKRNGTSLNNGTYQSQRLLQSLQSSKSNSSEFWRPWINLLK